MKPNYTAFIFLLVAVLLLVLNETLLRGQIPSWVFILILVAWIVVRFGPFLRRRQ
jgi:hypothetical protein